MFEAAASISPRDIKAYRNFASLPFIFSTLVLDGFHYGQAFPEALRNPANDPFFSVENATSWITSFGLQLYLEQDDTRAPATSLWSPDDASTTQLKAYRNYMLSDEFKNHTFFNLENTETWINPLAFQVYMESHYGSFEEYRSTRETPFSSRAPSRATSSISMAGTCAGSCPSIAPSSRASSPSSVPPSESFSRPPGALSFDGVVQFDDGDEMASVQGDPDLRNPHYTPKFYFREFCDTPLLTKPPKRKGKSRNTSEQIYITRQLKVDKILDISKGPSTWDVPRGSAVYRVDTSNSMELLTTKSGRVLTLDGFIRQEDQESWRGSAGHPEGDVKVRGLTSNPEEVLLCRRAHLYCNGVDTCEFIDPALFAGCERYEPDFEAMRELWNHELDANEHEAASAPSILARFYARIMNSKCKVACDGVPVLILRSKGPSAHGKKYFVGCSKWSRDQKFQHSYWPIAPNIDEAALKFALENNGLLPGVAPTVNATCVLTVHRRVKLQNCPYSHIHNNRMVPAKIKNRPCSVQMIIFVPIDVSYSHLALVEVRGPHNHQAHPNTKPSAEDRLKLGRAVEAAGLTGLTVQKLLNAPSTLTAYDGERVSTSSPAFTNTRKVRDFIGEKKKDAYPRGMGWEGVLYELSTREITLPKHERYIHTAMSKSGFRIVVTMHPQIAIFIHRILSLNIDFTFKRVEGEMDEWEIAGMLDRHKKRLTFGSLYCDTKTHEAFAQLFTELFDVIYTLTGEHFKLAPWYPDAKCRVIILDGEVPQAQGLADFLAKYNDPTISGLYTRDTNKLIKHCVKTCNPHFERHIDELPQHIPQSTIARIKSIMGLSTQEEIFAWIKNKTDEAIINWLAHKFANPWVFPSVNRFLSSIKKDDWDITPVHSNYAETAHAARNAETSVGVALLTAILQARDRDNIKALELLQVERDGVMSKRWNGPAEREKLSAQRQIWNSRKTAHRNNELTSYDTLKAERDSGTAENKASLARQKLLEFQIRSLQGEMKIDRHRTDLKDQVNELRKDVEEEKALRRDWVVRRARIDKELNALRKGSLAGARIMGRRPARPSGEGDSTGNEVEPAMVANSSSFEFSDDQEQLTIANLTGFEPMDQSMTQTELVRNSSTDGAMHLDANFSADLTAFEQAHFNNGSADEDFNMDDIFGGFDLSAFDFGAAYEPYNSNSASDVHASDDGAA
ncbi:hypothetical protein C8R43DRAFT_1126536 [Mycena crocata]|nr:hypothetical protein C8R43DRAFT_1126536 [Mycena crocata]